MTGVRKRLSKGTGRLLRLRVVRRLYAKVQASHAQQTKDLEREEGAVWGTISQAENLFSIEPATVQTYIGEAPFTQTLPRGAPGNIGPWIGWHILNKFESDHPKASVEQILHATAKKIFEEAKYRPK